MCIRDRPKNGRVPWENHSENNSEIRCRSRCLAQLCQHCPCLLYTSDAADERSSVDLGGRRIIKKKKTEDSAGRITVEKEGTYNKGMEHVMRTTHVNE